MMRRDPLAAPLLPRVSFAALVGLTAVLAAAVGLASTHVGPFALPPVPRVADGPVARPAPELLASPTQQPAAHWQAVLIALDKARSAAFASPEDARLLADVDLPESVAARLDERSRAQLAAAHLRAQGLRTVLTAVRVLRVDPARAVLAVTDRLAAYDLLDAFGQVVAHRPARGPATWRVTLVKAAGRWRVAEVARA